MIDLALTPDGDEMSELVWVAPVDLHRAFLADAELVRFSSILGDARRLVMGGAIPRPTRRELRTIVAQLDQVLHGSPHLRAHP